MQYAYKYLVSLLDDLQEITSQVHLLFGKGLAKMLYPLCLPKANQGIDDVEKRIRDMALHAEVELTTPKFEFFD